MEAANAFVALFEEFLAYLRVEREAAQRTVQTYR